MLQSTNGQLGLIANHHPQFKPLFPDWESAALRGRIREGLRGLLPRAVGLNKHPHLSVLDATAGLGRDGYVLAALGAEVSLCERQPLFAELLRDALEQLRGDATRSDIAERIEVIEADAAQLLRGDRRWDVVHLDPMYPHSRGQALPPKEMQILRALTGGDTDADALLEPARRAAGRRVVVKRPLHAPWMDGCKPNFQLSGKLARYDVYLPL